VRVYSVINDAEMIDNLFCLDTDSCQLFDNILGEWRSQTMSKGYCANYQLQLGLEVQIPNLYVILVGKVLP